MSTALALLRPPLYRLRRVRLQELHGRVARVNRLVLAAVLLAREPVPDDDGGRAARQVSVELLPEASLRVPRSVLQPLPSFALMPVSPMMSGLPMDFMAFKVGPKWPETIARLPL